jgi:lipoate synthase
MLARSYKLNPDAFITPELQTSHQTWDERQLEQEASMEPIRETLVEDVLAQLQFELQECDHCHTAELITYAVMCRTCNLRLCAFCDIKSHSCQPFHNRWLVSPETWISLLAMEFVEELTGSIFNKGINMFLLFLS